MKTAIVRDATALDEVVFEERCDVCVIGAGAAGSYLARRLGELGVDVVVLEAGGKKGSNPEAAGFEVDCQNNPYPGATEGRSFGLGGSTTRWGGLLVPHSYHDLRDAVDEHEPAWRSIIDVANRRGPVVLKRLGFHGEPAFEEFFRAILAPEATALAEAGLDVVTSLFLPFRRKNLHHLMEGSRFPGPAPRIYTNAIARDWESSVRGSIQRVVAVSNGHRSIAVVASRFIIAAGALESARTLLEIKRALPPGISLSSQIGTCLGDHLSVGIADVAPESLASATDRFAPRFEGGWMRSFRFMEVGPPKGAPRSFSHFVFENENPGFKLVKNVLTSLQARRFPRVAPGEVVSGINGSVGLAYSRFVRSKLYVPSDTPTRLQIDVEQVRRRRNRVTLGSQLDRSGRSIPEIHWTIGDEDVDQIRKASERLLSSWNAQSGRLPKLVPRDLSFDAEKPHDAYHPVGVCRMGADADSVVDLGLRVRGLSNAWVVSTAVLPSAGTANPTFTMLCLAEQVLQDLR